MTLIHHHYDSLGNTTELTDVDEEVTDTYQYDAWGELLSQTGTTPNPFQWRGRYGYFTNPDTGEVYVLMRTYDPMTGTWTTLDILRFINGINMYLAYFVPNGVDFSGLQCHGKPIGIQYIPNRGKFSFFATAQSNSSSLSTYFKIGFEPDSDKFKQDGCTCCDKIGFIQIVRNIHYSVNLIFNLRFSNDWIVDTSDEISSYPIYPFGVTKVTPDMSASLTDTPTRMLNSSLGGPYYMEQDLEACVVCISGNEGADIQLQTTIAPEGLSSSVYQTRGLSVYGCITYSHIYQFSNRSSAAEQIIIGPGTFMKSVFPDTKSATLKNGLPGYPPSPEFKSAVIW